MAQCATAWEANVIDINRWNTKLVWVQPDPEPGQKPNQRSPRKCSASAVPAGSDAAAGFG